MNTTNNAVTITGSGKITACVNGAIHTIDITHINYQKALDAVKKHDWDAFLNAVDLNRKVKDYTFSPDIQVVDGAIVYKGEVLHNTLTKKIIDFMRKDLPVLPLFRFLGNIMENPSKRAVDELCGFLDFGNNPITEDGHFLAFKNVRSDYTDIHSGTFDNSVGKVCEMPRWKVDDDKDRTCSTGLHFCSVDYLPHFSDSNGGKTMILKINPRDVVSIPSDYNNTKGRTCRYEVISEHTDNWRERVGRDNGFDFDLYASDGSEYEDEDDTEYCANCQTTLDNWDENSEMLCNSCYDDKYSGCYGGGCAGKTTNEDACDENHCFCDQQDEHGDQVCKQDQAQVGNNGNDGCCGGQCGCENNHNNQYGVKPSGHLFHNLRDAFGKFVKKNNLA